MGRRSLAIVLAFALSSLLPVDSVLAQCSGRGGGEGGGGASMAGAFGGGGRGGFGGAGGGAGFNAGGNPQVFARAMQQMAMMQRQNQVLQQQMMAMRQQMMAMQQENQRLLARLEQSGGVNPVGLAASNVGNPANAGRDTGAIRLVSRQNNATQAPGPASLRNPPGRGKPANR